jgi:beta-lactamase class D
MEQVKVLSEIFRGKTEFSLKHIEIVKDIMFIKKQVKPVFIEKQGQEKVRSKSKGNRIGYH